MTEIAAFIAAASQVTNIAKTLFEAHTQAERDSVRIALQGAMLEMQGKISEIQSRYQQLLETNKELYKKVAAHDQWQQESARYELHQLEPGIVVYALRDRQSAKQPEHWLCAACYNERKTSILFRESKNSDDIRCPNSVNHGFFLDER